MKPQRIDTARPTRADLLAFIADRKRAARGKRQSITRMQKARLDSAFCVHIVD
jgi:hypothetical protein